MVLNIENDYFPQAYAFTMSAEDSKWRDFAHCKAKDEHDGAGLTKCGITEKYDAQYFPEGKGINDLTAEEIKDIYFTKYYNPLLNKINSYRIAARIFDQRVNRGRETAIGMTKEALNQVKTGTFPLIRNKRGMFPAGTLDMNFVNVINQYIETYGEEQIYDVCIDNYEDHYRTLRLFPSCGCGWLRRLHFDNTKEMD